MLRYPATLALAMTFAVVSAGSMGAGILGLRPVFEMILNEDGPRGLHELIPAWNERLAKLPGHFAVPEDWAQRLPAGPFSAAAVIFGVLGLLTVVGAAANFLHVYLSLTVVNKTLADVRHSLFGRMLRLPLLTVTGKGPSDLVNRIIFDTWTLSTGFSTLISKAVADSTKGVVAVGVAVWLDWRMSAVSLAVAPLIYVVIRKLGSKIRRASRGALEHQADVTRTALESLQGFRVVKVHTTEDKQLDAFDTSNRSFLRELNRVRTARALASPLVEVIAIFAVGTMALVAVKAILDKELDRETMIQVLLALGLAGASLRPLTGLVNDIQQSSAAADRLAEIERELPEPGHEPGRPALAPHHRDLVFEGITLQYPGAQRPALREVSLTIRHGERVAFVGPNGCGKTTLLSLVPRILEPGTGRVLIDGVDVAGVSVESLRSQIGVVTQETILFRGTVAQNIAYGTPGATPEQIRTAAAKARADGFIVTRPGGYDADVAEQGASLSGGQRQRLAIARAIIRDPRILILDEATSMVDGESEAQIAEALTDFTQGRTCLIVAHRLSTVLSADRIVVMDEGRVVDAGRHDELIARCDVYKRLFEQPGS